MAVVSKSMCLITPSFPITNVVRRANSTLSVPIGKGCTIPYCFRTVRFMSLNKGNVTPICFANAALAGGLSILTPKITESLAVILAKSD